MLSVEVLNDNLCYSLVQDDIQSSLFALSDSTPAPSSKSEDSSVTLPEAWGCERFSVSITTCGVRHSLFHLALGSDLRNQVQFYLDCQNDRLNLDSPTSLAFPQRFYLIMLRELSPHQTSTTERPWQWVCRKQIKQQLKAEKR